MSADVESRFVTALAEAANERIVVGRRAWMFNTQIERRHRGFDADVSDPLNSAVCRQLALTPTPRGA